MSSSYCTQKCFENDGPGSLSAALGFCQQLLRVRLQGVSIAHSPQMCKSHVKSSTTSTTEDLAHAFSGKVDPHPESMYHVRHVVDPTEVSFNQRFVDSAHLTYRPHLLRLEKYPPVCHPVAPVPMQMLTQTRDTCKLHSNSGMKS